MEDQPSESSVIFLDGQPRIMASNQDIVRRSTIRFSISRPSLMMRHRIRIRQLLWSKFGVKIVMPENEFLYRIQHVYQNCLQHTKDLHDLHVKRSKGVELINEIVDRANCSYFTLSHVVHIFWSSLSCIHHFQMRLKDSRKGIIQRYRGRQFNKSVSTYKSLIHFIVPDLYRTALNATITFYKESRMWEFEIICSELLLYILMMCQNLEEGISDILRVCDSCLQKSAKDARQVIQVLYLVLEKIEWKRMSYVLMEQFLSMFEASIVEDRESNKYASLRSGLAICIKNIITNLNNNDLLTLIELLLRIIIKRKLAEEVLLDFGNITEQAANLCVSEGYADAIPINIMEHLADLISSTSSLHSLLGNRVFQFLIDRKKNKTIFLAPRIFLKNSDYGIVRGTYSSKDKRFFRQSRDFMHKKLFQSFANHSKNRINVEATYTTCAVILTELPCAYTAASGVCFAMAIQEYTLKNVGTLNIVTTHHLHSIVMALMSLICYLHNAEVFYEYVNTIMQNRAEWAPHLNPPLKPNYEYAEHHILWDKPELFFEDWACRFGLWKCFKGKDKKEFLI